MSDVHVNVHNTVKFNCDHPRQNQHYYCADNHFLVKAIIANYNLRTNAPANLKSPAQVDIR